MYFCCSCHLQVVFEAIRGTDYQGDIAIDDIKLSSGQCPQKPGELILKLNLHIFMFPVCLTAQTKCYF